MCALSGGTWDPKARRCIPKATGPKQLTPDELNAQVSLNILRRQEEAAAEGEKTAEKAHQDALELEAQVSLARLKRYEEAEEAADEMVKKNREAARSFLEMADPTAAFARQLEQVRALVAEGFLAPEAGREIEFALQTQIDRINEGTAETKKFKSAAEELGLTFSSAFEDAIAGGKRFSEILHGLEQDTLRIITRKLVTEPLAGAITSKISGSGIWDFFTNILGSFFGGARAIGGPVAAGVPYLVGERGPELFLPRRSGVVIPNDDLASAGAPNINITVNVPPTLSRETASQTAARVGQAVRAALRSNG